MSVLLDIDPSVEITASLWKLAAANTSCGERIVSLLLSKNPRIEITDTVTISALRNSGQGVAVIDTLHHAKKIKITGGVLEEIGKSGTITMEMRHLLSRYNDLQLTEDLMLKLVGNSESWNRIMRLLGNDQVGASITEAVLVKVVGNRENGHWIARKILCWVDQITVTESVVMSAARNSASGWEIMKLLLSNRHQTSITEGALVTTAGNEMWGLEALLMILNHDRIFLTGQVVAAVMRNPSCSLRAVMGLANHHNLGNVTIAAVAAAAGATPAGLQSLFAMQSILCVNKTVRETAAPAVAAAETGEIAYWPTPRRNWARQNWARNLDIQITEELLITAAGNEECADAMMGVLLGKIPDLEVSLSIVTAAAKNEKLGKQVIIRLLSRKDVNRITPGAIKAVVGNERWGQEWAEAFLNSHPGIEIIGMVKKEVAATALRRRIPAIVMLPTSYARRLFQRVAGILQASDLDFEAIVEESEGETSDRYRYRRAGGQ